MSIAIWLAFVAASVVLLLIPGPTVVLVASYALSQGRRVALACALGVALGDLIAIVLSLGGFGAVIAGSAQLFLILKWVGAVYLIWLAIGLWRAGVPASLAGASTAAQGLDTGVRAGAVFRHACVVTALNPKSIGFFLVFVPQFIDPAAPYWPQAGVIVVTFVTLGLGNALAYALMADRLRRQIQRPHVLQWLNRLGATALLGMAALTATARQS